MRIAVLVSNDLVHDQRVRKTCAVLRGEGHEVILVGRELPDSSPISREYETVRFSTMRFTRGACFYAELQWRLWRWLLKRNDVDAIWANDLDTLWPAWHIARKRRLPLIYDSHEYFTEAAGLTGRPFPKWVWSRIEGHIFPRLRHVITVNESIAAIYREKYGVDVKVVRNVPERVVSFPKRTRYELGLPEGPLAILQGAFLDKDRGVFEAVQALDYLPGVYLLLVGAGEEWEQARALLSGRQPESRVIFMPKQPYERLRELTASADLGLSLDKGVHFNYYHSLPNKLFDYMHAGIPVVASPLPEVKRVVEEWKTGVVVDELTPEAIANGVKEVLAKGKAAYADQLMKATETHHWQAESIVITKMLSEAFSG